jgi:hypothetical protein
MRRILIAARDPQALRGFPLHRAAKPDDATDRGVSAPTLSLDDRDRFRFSINVETGDRDDRN